MMKFNDVYMWKKKQCPFSSSIFVVEDGEPSLNMKKEFESGTKRKRDDIELSTLNRFVCSSE